MGRQSSRLSALTPTRGLTIGLPFSSHALLLHDIQGEHNFQIDDRLFSYQHAVSTTCSATCAATCGLYQPPRARPRLLLLLPHHLPQLFSSSLCLLPPASPAIQGNGPWSPLWHHHPPGEETSYVENIAHWMMHEEQTIEISHLAAFPSSLRITIQFFIHGYTTRLRLDSHEPEHADDLLFSVIAATSLRPVVRSSRSFKSPSLWPPLSSSPPSAIFSEARLDLEGPFLGAMVAVSAFSRTG